MYDRDPVFASIGPKALANVDRYFTNRIDTILRELLQNARRAGASEVDITFDADEDTMTIRDNGRGIDLDDIAILLAFGQSKNDDVIEMDEKSAGMGLFCLSKRDSWIESRDWRCRLTPPMFQGLEPAVPIADRKPIRGTVVTFNGVPMNPSDSSTMIVMMTVDLCRRMPFTVRLQGKTIHHFPATAELIPITSEGKVRRLSRTIGDCTVTVARFEDQSDRLSKSTSIEKSLAATFGTPFDPLPRKNSEYRVLIDIFGHVMQTAIDQMRDRDEITDIGMPMIHAAEAPFLAAKTDVRPRSINELNGRMPVYTALVECHGSSTLQAKLPDRETLVMTDGLMSIHRAIEEMTIALACGSHPNGYIENGGPPGRFPPRMTMWKATRETAFPFKPAFSYDGEESVTSTTMPETTILMPQIDHPVYRQIIDAIAQKRSRGPQFVFYPTGAEAFLPSGYRRVVTTGIRMSGGTFVGWEDGLEREGYLHALTAIIEGDEPDSALAAEMTTDDGETIHVPMRHLLSVCPGCEDAAIAFTDKVSVPHLRQVCDEIASRLNDGDVSNAIDNAMADFMVAFKINCAKPADLFWQSIQELINDDPDSIEELTTLTLTIERDSVGRPRGLKMTGETAWGTAIKPRSTRL